MTRKIGYSSTIIDLTTGRGVQATITVFIAGTEEKPTIYANAEGGAKSNPFETDSIGRFTFFGDPGEYKIEVSGQGITTYTIEGINLVGFSMPPAGMCRITNLYVNPETKKVKLKWDDIPI